MTHRHDERTRGARYKAIHSEQEVCRRVGCDVSQLREYVEEGLVSAPKSISGQNSVVTNRYTEDAIRQAEIAYRVFRDGAHAEDAFYWMLALGCPPGPAGIRQGLLTLLTRIEEGIKGEARSLPTSSEPKRVTEWAHRHGQPDFAIRLLLGAPRRNVDRWREEKLEVDLPEEQKFAIASLARMRAQTEAVPDDVLWKAFELSIHLMIRDRKAILNWISNVIGVADSSAEQMKQDLTGNFRYALELSFPRALLPLAILQALSQPSPNQLDYTTHFLQLPRLENGPQQGSIWEQVQSHWPEAQAREQ